MNFPQSTHINGIQTYGFTSRNELLEYISDKKQILIAVNAEKIEKRDHQLLTIINQNIGYADGIGSVFALKQKGIKRAVKIPGCELWLDIIQKNYTSKTFYFIGASEEVIQTTISKLKNQFPGIQIKGFRNGFLQETDIKDLKQNLLNTNPDFVFIAMGSPKQELLMEQFKIIHPAMYMGLGGSFDVYTGNVKRAPKLFVKFGLEWLYRLLKQPTRIKRQISLLNFMVKLIMNKY